MDCFLWKFLKTCPPFSSTLLTLFLLMSLCRFKKAEIHLTTYLKCLTTPSCTRSISPPKVWYQNHTKPVCSLGLWKYLKFQIFAIERIRSKQDREAGSPGTMEGGQCSSGNKRAPQCGCMKLTSVRPWPRDLWRLPENVLHTPTQCFSFVWLLSIFLRCERRQWALCDLAFPVSWSNHDSYWRFSSYQTQSAFSTHCINAHIGWPYIKVKHTCVGDSQKRGHLFWEFIHTQRQMTAEVLFSMLLPQNLLGRKGTFPSAVLHALGGGELVTLTSSFRLWLLLGNKWSSELRKGSSCGFLFFVLVKKAEDTIMISDWRKDKLNNPWRAGWLQLLSSQVEKRSWVKSVTTTRLKLGFCCL